MASHTISPAERIRELSAINADVAAMLQSAGNAIDSLTKRPLKTPGQGERDTEMTDGGNAATLEQRQQVFREQTTAYYTALQAVVARLRRQAYALEEAGIITAEAPSLASITQPRAATSAPGAVRGPSSALSAQEPERITNGGLGNLDVGWLNGRGNKIGAEKESELVEEAKSLLNVALSRGADEAKAANA